MLGAYRAISCFNCDIFTSINKSCYMHPAEGKSLIHTQVVQIISSNWKITTLAEHSFGVLKPVADFRVGEGAKAPLKAD